MPSIIRFLFGATLLLSATTSRAQSAIRFIVWNFEPVFETIELHVGLGFDSDINDRLSWGVQGRTSIESVNGRSWVASYHSAYHFSDTRYSSLYLGSNVGIRRVNLGPGATMVPVGVRLGLRGALEGFHADLYAGVGYNIGSGRSLTADDRPVMHLRTMTYCIGVDLGLGWDTRRR